jgi:hypothetical protein
MSGQFSKKLTTYGDPALQLRIHPNCWQSKLTNNHFALFARLLGTAKEGQRFMVVLLTFGLQ